METIVQIIGAGLAGCEAAWQIATRGIKVKLFEMKPHKHSPAHKSDDFAELVCSNSLRSDDAKHNAVGLMHEEMRMFNSLVMQCADACKVPAGGALQAADEELVAALQEKTNNYLKYLKDMEFRKAFNELRAIWVDGNNYISATEPWTVIKENPERAATILRVCINLIRIFAILCAPIMPETADKIMSKFSLRLQETPLKDFASHCPCIAQQVKK